jgi:hypothetical protein
MNKPALPGREQLAPTTHVTALGHGEAKGYAHQATRTSAERDLRTRAQYDSEAIVSHAHTGSTHSETPLHRRNSVVTTATHVEDAQCNAHELMPCSKHTNNEGQHDRQFAVTSTLVTQRKHANTITAAHDTLAARSVSCVLTLATVHAENQTSNATHQNQSDAPARLAAQTQSHCSTQQRRTQPLPASHSTASHRAPHTHRKKLPVTHARSTRRTHRRAAKLPSVDGMLPESWLLCKCNCLKDT